jgi:hypothetical protein
MHRSIILGIFIFSVIVGGTFAYKSYAKSQTLKASVADTSIPTDTPIVPAEVVPPKPIPTHVSTPTPVRAIYVSSWVASSPKAFARILDILETTEVNAIVLDIKDATGRVSFLTDNEIIAATGSPENRIRNIVEFLNKLHEKNIYVIGRISTFQDPYLTKIKPEWAITRKSDGFVWKDRKGLSFLNPANRDVWDYTVAVAQTSYDVGFDEINFDYIRYPSDGNMAEIDYQLAEGETRADHIESFFAHLHERLRVESNIPISADLFGLTTTETTDMGIGQVFERAIPYFDYIAPMVYPSHYAKGEYGIPVPAEEPYKIITKALVGAKQKIDTMLADPNVPQSFKDRISFSQIRPWLQDFDMGATYDAEKVRAQLQATYDAGLDSWMMWDPRNGYTKEAYELIEN